MNSYANTFSAVFAGYKGRRRYIKVWICRRSRESLDVLRRVGLISGFIRSGSRYMVSLFYIDGKPPYSDGRVFLRPSSPYFVNYRSLIKLADYNYGGFLILSTSRGLLTHSECLLYRTGGRLAFMLHG